MTRRLSAAVWCGLVTRREARSCRHLATPLLTDTGWCESKARYWSVWVGLRYTVLVRLPSGSLWTMVSRNAMLLSCSFSMVNWMLGLRLFRWLSRRLA